ncbi:uncharacterized protein LOC130554877 [Triplophysa rosa]|uniref:uncharacterized protein LOC130554877 n=1 Tax=Triplophysa rosa TaxID=992332 RepID=UPI002545D60E|nr:uncharacterized protein LOC130554877 [Triplophysa rosa]
MDKLIHLILLSGLVCNPGSLAENLALKGTTTQSSTYSTWAAQNAIDGVRYGPDASTHCTSTSSESNPWWRLDLLDVYNISTVIITAHKSHLNAASGAEIRVGNSLDNNGNNNLVCAVTPDPLSGNTETYSCHGMEGRYVNVILSGDKNNLTLCEVEVYGTENLALKGTATQSSTLYDRLPVRAIDGVRHGTDTNAYCSTTQHQSDPWWRLDLLDEYEIKSVIITARSDGYLDQTSGAEIRIGNSLDNNGNNNPICAVTPVFQHGYTISFSCHGMVGRYVNVVKPGLAFTVSLCEMEVYKTENLAFKGTTTQSSFTWVSQYAMDGQKYGTDTGSYCSATLYESNPWWRLDLLDYYNISTVIITARSDCCVDQTNGAEIRIGNSLVNNGNNNPICAVTSGLLAGHTISYSCQGMVGHYVNVVMSGRTSALALCEVEVYGKFLGFRRKTFLRLKFSSSVDVAAESEKILQQLQSALASHISDFNLSWTQLPEREEEPEEETRSCDKNP